MKPLDILLMEDNAADVFLFEEVLETLSASTTLSVAIDGVEAIRMLDERFQKATLPDIIILDINVAQVNGHKVAGHIKTSDHLKHIPVIMFSSSSYYKDICMAYNQYVNCFICKPQDLDEYTETIKAIVNFWSKIAKLPSNVLSSIFLQTPTSWNIPGSGVQKTKDILR